MDDCRYWNGPPSEVDDWPSYWAPRFFPEPACMASTLAAGPAQSGHVRCSRCPRRSTPSTLGLTGWAVPRPGHGSLQPYLRAPITCRAFCPLGHLSRGRPSLDLCVRLGPSEPTCRAIRWRPMRIGRAFSFGGSRYIAVPSTDSGRHSRRTPASNLFSFVHADGGNFTLSKHARARTPPSLDPAIKQLAQPRAGARATKRCCRH